MSYPNVIAGRIQLLLGVITLIILTGCATPDNRLQVDYLMPPREIADLSSISPLSIAAKITLTGNAVSEYDLKSAQNDLCGRIAAQLNDEGFCKTVDVLWGDSSGVDGLQQLMKQKKFPHGYDLYSASEIESARLEVFLEADIKKHKKKTEREAELTYLPYKRDKSDIPSSSPNYERARVKKQQVEITVYTVDATGKLQAVLYDKSGKIAYQKEFNSLTYHEQYGYEKIAAIPVNSAIIAKMIMPAIDQIIADISPHTESREIEINEDGNKKTVLLLKAHAYTEAIKLLDEIISEGDPKIADVSNMAIALEVIGEYQAASDFWQQGLEIDKSNEVAQLGMQRVEQIINAKKELQKQKLRKANSFKRKIYKDQ